MCTYIFFFFDPTIIAMKLGHWVGRNEKHNSRWPKFDVTSPLTVTLQAFGNRARVDSFLKLWRLNSFAFLLDAQLHLLKSVVSAVVFFTSSCHTHCLDCWQVSVPFTPFDYEAVLLEHVRNVAWYFLFEISPWNTRCSDCRKCRRS